MCIRDRDYTKIGAGVWDEFDVAARDEAAEHGECSARGGVDGGGKSSEGGKLLLVKDGLVKALRSLSLIHI